jgi:PTS system glucitol/sorbitol-specific IIC component
MAKYNTVKINKGSSGWGKYLIVTPTDEKNLVISMTGGGIHPLAQKIADLSGGTAIDAFKNPPANNDAVFCAVVDCGGTLRTGLYPKLGVPTVNILDGGPAGVYAEYCTEDMYVSGTKEKDIVLADGETAKAAAPKQESSPASLKKEASPASSKAEDKPKKKGLFEAMTRFMEVLGRFIGKVVGSFFNGGRQAVNMLVTNILPFIIFLSFIQGLMTSTGLGTMIANGLSVFTGSVIGLIIFALIIGIPVLSPLLGPGAAVQSVLGTLIGTQIAAGAIPVTLALPALFAISIVDACDFIPVAAALGEAEADTARIAVPAMLFSRFVTAPIAVLIGVVAGIGLY